MGEGINLTKSSPVIAYDISKNKNSSGDEIANVNFYAVRLEAIPELAEITLSRTGSEYQPKCSDTLRLGSKGRCDSFHLWMHVWVAGKTLIPC